MVQGVLPRGVSDAWGIFDASAPSDRGAARGGTGAAKMTNKTIYSIGHSNHQWRKLLNLLQMHGIGAVCDVRSRPYSRFNPQFNREPMRDALQVERIAYIYLGGELGGRPEDEGCYENGQVRYDRVARSEGFRRGLARLRKGRETHRLALMCAEKDPLHCHRMLLISRQLAEDGIPVLHILANGKLETQEQALERLLARLAIPAEDLLRSRDEAILAAYSAQAGKVAYRRKRQKAAEPAGTADKPASGETR